MINASIPVKLSSHILSDFDYFLDYAHSFLSEMCDESQLKSRKICGWALNKSTFARKANKAEREPCQKSLASTDHHF